MSRTLGIVPSGRYYDPSIQDYARGFSQVIGHIDNMRKRMRSGSSNGGSRKRYRSRGSNRISGNTSGVTPVSSQYNVSRIQKAGRLGRGGKRSIRRFKKFRARVRAAMSSDVPNSYVIRQSFRNMSTAQSEIPNAAQTLGSIGFMDNAIVTQAFTAETLSPAVDSEDTLALKGGSCELLFSVGGGIADDYQAMVDVYLLKARRNIPNSLDAEAADQFADSISALANLGNGPSSLTWGTTPFEAPYFLKNWKITQTWRLNLSPGQQPTSLEKTFNWKNRRVMGGHVGANRQLKGTYAWLFVSRGVPQFSEGDGTIAQSFVQVAYNQVLHYEKFDPATAGRAKNV